MTHTTEAPAAPIGNGRGFFLPKKNASTCEALKTADAREEMRHNEAVASIIAANVASNGALEWQRIDCNQPGFQPKWTLLSCTSDLLLPLISDPPGNHPAVRRIVLPGGVFTPEGTHDAIWHVLSLFRSYMPTINTHLQPALAGLVLAMKRDILELGRDGRVPPDVQNFAQLHDHCDANCLGGLCTDEKFNALIAKFGGRDENESQPQGMLDIIAKAQNAITAWIQDGGIATTPALSMVQNQPIQPTV